MRAHRLPPAGPDPGGIRGRVRDLLLAGALIELAATDAGERVIDVIARAAGARRPVHELGVGSGGGVLLARLPLEHGESILRVAASGSPSDPSRAAAALELLAAEGLHVAPRLVGKGEEAGASWTAETFEPGRRPRRLSNALAQSVSQAWTQLPGWDGPPTALAEDLESIAAQVPRCASALRSLVKDARPRCEGVPGRMRHGDLWTANLLETEHGGIVAVDWDAWHAAGVPGADLLQLCVTEWRHARRESLGTAWRRRPWADPAYLRLTAPYWNGIGVQPHPDLLETVGLAWWAGEVAGTLARLPERRTDSAWLAANVDAVLTECGV